jgi:hypothetical protein
LIHATGDDDFVSPSRTPLAAIMIAFNPDPHTLFTVTAETVLGKPPHAAWRADSDRGPPGLHNP